MSFKSEIGKLTKKKAAEAEKARDSAAAANQGGNAAGFLALANQIQAVSNAQSNFATSAEVQAAADAAELAAAAASDAADALQNAQEAATNAAQDAADAVQQSEIDQNAADIADNTAANAAEEAQDVIEEAQTDSEQLAQDQAIAQNTSNINTLNNALATEVTNNDQRHLAAIGRLESIEAQLPDDDSGLLASIAALELDVTDAEAAIVANAADIAQELLDRAAGDTALDARLAAVEAQLPDDDTALAASIAANAAAIANEISDTNGDITALLSTLAGIQTDVNSNAAAIVTEQGVRASADAALQSDVDDRVLRTGDTMTGRLNVPVGAAGGIGLGTTSSITSTSTLMTFSMGNANVVNVSSSATRNFIQSLGGPGKTGGFIAFNDTDINTLSWSIIPRVDATESSFWIAPVKNGRKGQVLGNTSGITLESGTVLTSSGLVWETGARELMAQQGANLIYNGNGWRGDTENLVSSTVNNVLTIDADDGSFAITGSSSSSMFFTDKVAVLPDQPVRYKGKVKGTDGRVYFGIRFWDANDDIIDTKDHSFYTDSLTTLTQPFTPGDTVMHVADASGWLDTDGSTTRGGVAFSDALGYKEGKADEGPEGMTQFSWNVFTSVGAGGGFVADAVANTITFASPVTRADYFNDNAAWPVGSNVRQPITRGPYKYTLVNYVVTDQYLESDVTLNPSVGGSAAVAVPAGARYAQPMMLCLRNVTDPTATQNFKDMILTQEG